MAVSLRFGQQTPSSTQPLKQRVGVSKVLGIDLGTTNSVVSVWADGKPQVLPNAELALTTPSVVAWPTQGNAEPLVGEPAQQMEAFLPPTHTIRSIKRQMGTKTTIPVNGQQLTPEQVSALILKKLKSDAHQSLGQDIQDAVITVPAYFNEPQRQATRKAAEMAGLNVLRLVNEPTAAALAYGLDKTQA